MARWLPEEIDYLTENSAAGVAVLARRLGRSREAIKTKAHYLGVALGRGRSGDWSEAEAIRLKAFSNLGDQALSEIIQRSIGAIRFRASSENISLRRNGNMLDAIEESAAIMEHDGGWPKLASEAMSAACQYMFNGDRFHRLVAKDYLRKNCPDLLEAYDEDDRFATQVNLAKSAFDAVGTIEDVRKIDRDLADRFEYQAQLWERAKGNHDREEHAGGMTRGYLALVERILNDG